MAASYLDVDAFKARTVMPSDDVDAVAAGGYLVNMLAEWSERMDAVLRKRYAVPFASPVPEVIKGWLTLLVTPLAYDRRGWNPSDAQSARIIDRGVEAWKEINQAADSQLGAFDLPITGAIPLSGVVFGGPLGYTETSPYRWTTLQRDDGSYDDGL